MWHQLLCQQGYIVVSCDPRGTQFRGRVFKHSTYMNLGKLETEDFIDFAKYLGSQSYIDRARIGIQGWSFGGYMTSLCMTKGADFFKAGIAVADISAELNVPERSVIAKLSSLGVYVKKSYVNKRGETPVKKSEHIERIAELLDVDEELLESLEKVNKTVLKLIEHKLAQSDPKLHYTRQTDHLFADV